MKKLDRMKLRDRRSAGRLLAQKLAHYQGHEPIVVAVACGGVPVGAEVADGIGASLDVSVVHKIGAPSPEQGAVAVVEGGHLLALDEAAWRSGIRDPSFVALGAREASSLERRAHDIRGGRPPLDVKGRMVIVVDDGVSSGLTAWATIKTWRERGAARVVLAVPIAAAPIATSLDTVVDELVCLVSPEQVWSVRSYYGDFEPVSDDEAAAYLRGERDEVGRPQLARASGWWPWR